MTILSQQLQNSSSFKKNASSPTLHMTFWTSGHYNLAIRNVIIRKCDWGMHKMPLPPKKRKYKFRKDQKTIIVKIQQSPCFLGTQLQQCKGITVIVYNVVRKIWILERVIKIWHFIAVKDDIKKYPLIKKWLKDLMSVKGVVKLDIKYIDL